MCLYACFWTQQSWIIKWHFCGFFVFCQAVYVRLKVANWTNSQIRNTVMVFANQTAVRGKKVFPVVLGLPTWICKTKGLLIWIRNDQLLISESKDLKTNSRKKIRVSKKWNAFTFEEAIKSRGNPIKSEFLERRYTTGQLALCPVRGHDEQRVNLFRWSKFNKCIVKLKYTGWRVYMYSFA